MDQISISYFLLGMGLVIGWIGYLYWISVIGWIGYLYWIRNRSLFEEEEEE